jgi:hypothetical protein
MKLDAETLRKLALSGARTQLRELETQTERLREAIRQLSGASVPGPKSTKKPEKRRKRRSYSDKFKASVVKEARIADNASAIGKKHNVSPSLVRLWMEKAEK